jgi:SPP1 family phage portal protein
MRIIKYQMTEEMIPKKDLMKLIKEWGRDIQPVMVTLEQYYKARNTHILSRTMVKGEAGSPDNKIPISYGRKLVKTVQGYMYKPGNIQYIFEEGEDDTKIREIFKDNDEQVKTSTIRTYAIADGNSYELHYVDTINGEAKPRFTIIKASKGFMVYDYAIEPNKNAFIYEYRQGDDLFYKVYYDSAIITYLYDTKTAQLIQKEEATHLYGEVPVIDHRNDFERESDIIIVKKLIDAYDVLMSDSMNEFDRFAWAYLLLTGIELTEEDLKKIKEMRVFQQLDSKDAVSFLTKEIPTAYIEFMKKWIRSEIHAQSFIPDLEEVNFGGQTSGVSIDRFIYIMEYTAVDKEAFTKIALQQRFTLMRNLPTLEIPEAKIIMLRNTPATDSRDAEIANKYLGILSKRTILENYSPAVEDVEEELIRIEEEKEDIPDLDNIESIAEKEEDANSN